MKKWLVITGILFFVLVMVAVGFFFLLRKPGPVTLTWWGLWEPEAVYQTVIADYQRTHPNITIKYAKQSQLNYRDRVTTALAGTDSPDIIRLHNSWLPMFKNLLVPAPETFANIFYPVVSTNYGLPLGIDTLVMFINDDLFRAGGVNVPVIWDGAGGFLEVANKLTVKDGYGRIKTAGTALGTASNVDHWQDIISLMMLQAGVDLDNNPNSSAAVQALGFYGAFARGQNIWDETQDNSTLAFASGKIAMYFGPSWRYFDIKALSPNLNFRMVPVPQLAGGTPINLATYWFEGVSKKSKNPKIAWDFLKFATTKDELTKTYTAQAKLRPFGEPYPRIDMANLLPESVVIQEAPTAKSWYLASFTNDGDTGINSRIGKYYFDAVNAMLRGADAKSILDTVQKGVNQVLQSYGVAK